MTSKVTTHGTYATKTGTRVHFRSGIEAHVTACGRFISSPQRHGAWVPWTSDPAKVTCQVCLKAVR